MDVTLRKVAEGFCLEVADDGRSFQGDPNAPVKKNQRLGLLGMQERVRLINGEFIVKPQLGKGTIIRVVVPFGAGDSRMRSKRIGMVRKVLRRVLQFSGERASRPSALQQPALLLNGRMKGMPGSVNPFAAAREN